MASEPTTPADGPPPDPFEAELVAYLDGELDDAAARKVEERLAKDPAARTRAAELKKSFDLLDYLPKSEPSVAFTTRTLDKLPPVKATENPLDSTTPRDPQPASSKTPSPHMGGPSTSLPIPLEPEPEPQPQARIAKRPKRERSFFWAGGLVFAVVAFVAIGYLGASIARPHLFSRTKQQDEAKPDPEPRVIEHLPLYAVADDLAFVVELAKPENFGEDSAVVFDSTLKIPSIDAAEKASGQQFETMAKAFRALPAARQAEIVKLDQELHAKEPKERDRLFRVLEVYTAWLARLPDSDRRAVLNAPNAEARLKAIRAVRDRQWLETLPPPMKAKLDAITNSDEKKELLQQWKEEEATRRDRLAFIRQHVEAFAANSSPWPFDTERGRNDVIDFARNVLKIEDKRKCRVSLADLAEYHRTLASARSDDTWAWYGLMVYELSKLHPSLPESDNPKLMISEINELPEPYLSRVNPKKAFGPRVRLDRVGKWPDFPLEVHKEVPLQPFGKGPFMPPQLGPARVSEFKQPVRDFATNSLFPKMSGDEKRELDRLQGKWPEYPQKFMHYAQKYDLAVPGVTLPGSPKKWDATYGLRSGSREK